MQEDIESMTSGVNSVEATQKQGVVGKLMPELSDNTPDKELLELAEQVKKDWDNFIQPYLKRGKVNRQYWKGRQWRLGEYAPDTEIGTVGTRPYVDNLIFESLETFLPLATRANPEAVIKNGTDEEKLYVQTKLKDLADDNRLKLTVKDAVRKWALDWFVGVECYFDPESEQPNAKVIPLSRLILDKNATIEAGKYTGKIVGIYEEESVKDAIERFEKLSQVVDGAEEDSTKVFLTKEVDNQLGTKIKYIKWYTPEIVFFIFKGRILGKTKNPNWNYETQEIVTNDIGNQTTQIITPKNHFKKPKIPVEFLSIFNTGEHPVDDTNLIWQVIPEQDQVNKRGRQIDKNNDGINGGWVVSGQKSGLTAEQSTPAIETLHDGGAIFIPSGNPNEAIAKMVGQALPQEVYLNQQDARNRLRGIFGTSASTPQGIATQETARGKILAKTTDDSRIGGGISEFIEQLSDGIFNQWLQLLYVHDPTFQQIQTHLKCSVKEGSMIPKDSLTRRNEAIELYQAGALAPIDLFKRLEDPNPEQTANNLLQWKLAQMAPQAMAMQPTEQSGTPQPTIDQQLLSSVPV